ncbi:MAG: hypothetical protein M1828_007171 [Chrysothrix sp. TS-e1954]|nr:MAG: hypothetical protein M1828_007171 [Chrysothrix sp. TS-e1954]
MKKLRQHPFRVQWRAAFIRLPRLAPIASLRATAPEGPYPFVIKIPARAGHGHHVEVHVFIPPEPRRTETGGVGIHLDFHGGSFIMGSCVEQGPFCAKLARERGIIVLCVDYAKGPFYQFPAALQDVEDVLMAVLDTDRITKAGRILHENIEHQHPSSKKDTKAHSVTQKEGEYRIDPQYLSVSGFSSGGNLALNLATSVSQPGIDWPSKIPPGTRPILFLLFYPSLDLRALPHERKRHPKVPAPGKISKSIETILTPTYLHEEDRNHPRANPGLMSTGNLHDRARIFLVLPEYDTLAVQSEAWVKKMEDEGQADIMRVHRSPGQGHAFCNIPEKFVNEATLKEKLDTYEDMMSFWDKCLEEQIGDSGRANGHASS